MDEPTKHWSSSYFWRSLCINDSDTEASHVSTSLSTWIAKMKHLLKNFCGKRPHKKSRVRNSLVPMNTPGAHDLCTFATLVSPSEMPFPSICLNLSLLWTPCSKPNSPGKSFPVHTASRNLLNSKKTHCLGCNRTLTSSGRSFWFIFMCPCLALLPGCEPLEGEDLVNLCNWHIENAQ